MIRTVKPRKSIWVWSARAAFYLISAAWIFTIPYYLSFSGERWECELHDGIVVVGTHRLAELPWGRAGAVQAAREMFEHPRGWCIHRMYRPWTEPDLHSRKGWCGYGMIWPGF